MEYQKSITVDGKRYTVLKFTGSKSIRLLTRIFKLVGEPVVGLAVMAAGDKGTNAEINPDVLKGLVGGMFDKLDENGVETLIKDILENTLDANRNTPVTADFDTRFQGEPLHIMQLVWASLEVQYGNFLSVLGGLGKFSPTAKAASASPLTSAGTSGAA